MRSSCSPRLESPNLRSSFQFLFAAGIIPQRLCLLQTTLLKKVLQILTTSYPIDNRELSFSIYSNNIVIPFLARFVCPFLSLACGGWPPDEMNRRRPFRLHNHLWC